MLVRFCVGRLVGGRFFEGVGGRTDWVGRFLGSEQLITILKIP